MMSTLVPHADHVPKHTHPAASADLSYSGFVMLGCLMAAMWICYFLILAVIRFGQRELGRQQEVQDRLFSILHPLLGPGSAANRCVGTGQLKSSTGSKGQSVMAAGRLRLV